MTDAMKVLAVLPDTAVSREIEPYLSRSHLQVTRVESGLKSLSLLSGTAFDLIVVQDPLPDLGLETFLSVLGEPDCASGESPTLILTRDARLDALERFLDGRRVQACCVDVPGDTVQRALTELVGIALRAGARLLVQTEIRVRDATMQRACQTVNISETGILIRTPRPLPTGTEIAFTLDLPDGTGRIAGTGTVVRQTVPEVERLSGLGLRILRLEGDGRQRLAAFVRSQMS